MSAAERRLERIREYVEANLALIPEEKDENETWQDEAYDDLRGTLQDIQARLTGPLGETFGQIHIDGRGFRTVGIYRLFFKAALRDVRKRQADYDAEVRDWYENGDGRPSEWVTDYNNDGEPGRSYNIGGKGHTFPTCIHGVSRWVDYDCACGWCEEGSSVVDIARVEARTNFLRFVDHWDFVQSIPNTVPYETRRSLEEITITLFPSLDNTSGH